MKLLPWLFLLISAVAFADVLEWRGANGNIVALLDEPCVSKKGALDQIPPKARAEMKAAHVYINGRAYEACYGHYNATLVFLFDEDGDGALIEKKIFRPRPGA